MIVKLNIIDAWCFEHSDTDMVRIQLLNENNELFKDLIINPNTYSIFTKTGKIRNLLVAFNGAEYTTKKEAVKKLDKILGTRT